MFSPRTFASFFHTRRWNRKPRLKKQIQPQEILVQDINALLQTAAQEQTPRPVTRIDFLETQHHPLSRINEEHNSWLMASLVRQAQDL
jgi:hypothetical protein